MAVIFNGVSLKLLNGTINLEADTFYAMLVTAIPSASAAIRSDVTATELAGGTYVRKDLVKAGTFPATFGSNGATADFNDVTWTDLYTTSAQTIAGIIIVKGTVAGSAAGDNLLCFLRDTTSPAYTTPTSSAGVPYTFAFNASGALTAQPV